MVGSALTYRVGCGRFSHNLEGGTVTEGGEGTMIDSQVGVVAT